MEKVVVLVLEIILAFVFFALCWSGGAVYIASTWDFHDMQITAWTFTLLFLAVSYGIFTPRFLNAEYWKDN